MSSQRKPVLPVREALLRTGGSGLAGSIGVLLAMLLLSALLGLVFAAYPLALSAKLTFFILGAVVLLYAAVAAGSGTSYNVGVGGRRAINLWVFLLGACPIFLPFKFGPLPGLNPLRIAYALMLAIWLYSLITSPTLRVNLSVGLRRTKLIASLLSLGLIWQLICSAISVQPIYSLYYDLKLALPAYLMFMVALTFFRSADDMQRTAAWLTAGTLVSCIVALIEWRTRTNLFIPFFPSDPELLASLEWILLDKSRSGEYRVSGTFAHPLALAEYLCMVFPLVIMLAAKATKRVHRTLAWGVLPLLVSTLYLSHTRSAIIAAVSSLIVIALLFGARSTRQRGKPGRAMLGWLIVVGAVASAIVLSGSVGYLAQGRSSAEAGSSGARVIMFNRTLTLMEKQPVQGYGSGTAGFKIGRLPGQSAVSVDSYYISRALESGYVGLALFVIAALAIVGRSALAALRTTGIESWLLLSLATALFASLVVKTVLSLTDSIDLFYLICGISVVAANLTRRDSNAYTAFGQIAQGRARAYGLLRPVRN